jgi:hypothetical protein
MSTVSTQILKPAAGGLSGRAWAVTSPHDQGPANLSPRFNQPCYLEVDRGRHWNRIVGVRIRRPLFALNLRVHRTFRLPSARGISAYWGGRKFKFPSPGLSR